MDSLQETERALAWSATWDPSFAGMAIINEDFTYRSVNPQFCEILKVTPGELIGRNFADITPQPVKDLDVLNAKLVKSRTIQSYLLPKEYEFSNGRRIKVILLVVGVFDQEQNFRFFVSRIMKDHPTEKLSLPSHSPKSDTFISQMRENWHIVTAILGAVALVLSYIIEKLHLLKSLEVK